ncbi:hypothetical protein BCEN4_330008 [Burkholderia cenocepacia]|nr:hypothetical protein BCEN4_330008 [Burkholderia cenocepacia]
MVCRSCIRYCGTHRLMHNPCHYYDIFAATQKKTNETMTYDFVQNI